MPFPIHHPPLLRSWLAGAIVLGGALGCSRSDRTSAARDTTQTGAATVPADTQSSAATRADTAARHAASPAVAPKRTGHWHHKGQAADTAAANPRGAVGYEAMGTGATAPLSRDTTSTEMANASAATEQKGTYDTTAAGKSATAAAGQANADTTKQAETDRVQPPADSTERLGRISSDTSATGQSEMARDTSQAVAQAETSQARADTMSQMPADTSPAVHAQVDTIGANQSASNADTVGATANAAPVRPPEDSTQTYGQVGGESNADSLPTQTERIQPPADSAETLGNANAEVADTTADQAVAAAAPVQSTGNIATGADAVALMSREGKACRVENSTEVQWDLASSPSTLNPCGSGTMTLPRVKTGQK